MSTSTTKINTILKLINTLYNDKCTLAVGAERLFYDIDSHLSEKYGAEVISDILSHMEPGELDELLERLNKINSYTAKLSMSAIKIIMDLYIDRNPANPRFITYINEVENGGNNEFCFNPKMIDNGNVIMGCNVVDYSLMARVDIRELNYGFQKCNFLYNVCDLIELDMINQSKSKIIYDHSTVDKILQALNYQSHQLSKLPIQLRLTKHDYIIDSLQIILDYYELNKYKELRSATSKLRTQISLLRNRISSIVIQNYGMERCQFERIIQIIKEIDSLQLPTDFKEEYGLILGTLSINTELLKSTRYEDWV